MPRASFLIDESESAVNMKQDSRILKVKVYTRSSRPRVETADGETFKVYVSTAPEKGKANAEVIKVLAAHLGVKKSALVLVSGQTSRDKLIKMSD